MTRSTRPAQSGFTCTFPPTLRAPRDARRTVDAWPVELDAEILDTLRLLVSEVIGLSVRADEADGEAGAPIELSVQFDGNRVRVEVVRDTGRFVFPSADADAPDLSFSLIDELSDRWGLTRLDHGTLCWLEIDLWPATDPSVQ
jgi:hypothetical protein